LPLGAILAVFAVIYMGWLKVHEQGNTPPRTVTGLNSDNERLAEEEALRKRTNEAIEREAAAKKSKEDADRALAALEKLKSEADATKAKDEVALAATQLEQQKAEVARLTAIKTAMEAEAKAAAEEAKLAKLVSESERQKRDMTIAESEAAEQRRNEGERLQQAEMAKATSIKEFMQAHIQSYLSDDANDWASAFADYSDYKYYTSVGQAPRSFVVKDRAGYLSIYPHREFRLLNNAQYTLTHQNDGSVRIDYSYSYTVRGAKTKSGKSNVNIIIRLIKGRWQIIKYDENVIRD
jgi:hypothetical protein